MNKHLKGTIISICLMAGALSASAQLYKNADAPVEARVEDLLKRMTLEEKVDQMCMVGLGDVASTRRMYGT